MKKVFVCVLLILLLITTHPVYALSFIRDTEVESVLTTYVRNIFKQVGLNPKNARVIIVNDDSINAFVAGGQTIFIHTGLITQVKNVDDIMFVLAHETGHIVGGHITRGQGIYSKARTTALISTILGGLVAVAGRPDAGIAVMMGGSSSAAGIFTAYQQTEESAADRTAVDILNKTHYSMLGFSNTMKIIQAQDRLNSNNEMTYLRTHPMTQDRVKALNRFLENPLPLKKDTRFELIQAKLIGFLYPPQRTLDIYRNKNDLAANYARAIALYRSRQLQASLTLIDSLIAQKPDYPYFYELKAQFSLESGLIDQAITYYEKALQLMPQAPLMRLSLAQALLETNSSTNAQKAIHHLKEIIAKDDNIPFAWQLLATAYERTNQQNEILYAMAELYRTQGDIKSAKKMAEKALKKLKKGTPVYQRTQDILHLPEEENNRRYY